MTFEEFIELYALTLSNQQEEAIKYVNGCLLLLAVPGSGKTTTLITRLAYMTLCLSIKPEEILALTFTDNAANEMKNRFIEKYDARIGKKIRFSTINSLCYEISNTGFGKKKVADDTEKKSILYNVYSDYYREEPTDSQISLLSNEISLIKNSINPDIKVRWFRWKNPNILFLYNEYNNMLRKLNKIDFDDQLINAYAVANEKPEVFEQYQNNYKYICVDEAQDTSEIQHALIKLLSTKNNNVFMVGDEDQSIYAFRGAEPNYLLQFTKDYPGAEIYKLSTNYRSAKNIVSAANLFISKNKNRIEKDMTSYRNVSGYVIPITVSNLYKQYDILLSNIIRQKGEIAILYRNNISGIPLMYLFEKNYIKYYTSNSLSRFFEYSSVSMYMDLLEYSFDFNNKELFQKIIRNTKLLSSNLVNKTINNTKDDFLLKVFINEAYNYSEYNDEEHKANTISLVKEIIDLFYNIASQPVSMHIETLNKFYSRRPEKLARFIFNDYIKQGLDYIFVGNNRKQLFYYLNTIKQKTTNLNSSKEGIFISTIHSAKGMEFEKVYIIDCVDGILPSNDPSTDPEEERRLFYVAITRAKNNLYLLNRKDATSSFINEILPMQTYPR
ncbi:MAG: ATP-dependent helicase [Erysipelotrichaceae bacterium]|nr:ATP-dependent helicase [Erysipelotrichaceae bacterium]